MKTFKKYLYLFAGSIYLIDAFKQGKKSINRLEEEFLEEFGINENSKMYDECTARFGFVILQVIVFLLLLPIWPVLLVLGVMNK